jgi:hypothetical protein
MGGTFRARTEVAGAEETLEPGAEEAGAGAGEHAAYGKNRKMICIIQFQQLAVRKQLSNYYMP